MGASLLSGLAEPIGAGIGYLALSDVLSDAVFGTVFGLIAGVMVFLALDALLPAAKRYAQGHETVYGLVSGMGTLAISLVLFRFATLEARLVGARRALASLIVMHWQRNAPR